MHSECTRVGFWTWARNKCAACGRGTRLSTTWVASPSTSARPNSGVMDRNASALRLHLQRTFVLHGAHELRPALTLSRFIGCRSTRLWTAPLQPMSVTRAFAPHLQIPMPPATAGLIIAGHPVDEPVVACGGRAWCLTRRTLAGRGVVVVVHGSSCAPRTSRCVAIGETRCPRQARTRDRRAGGGPPRDALLAPACTGACYAGSSISIR